MFSIRFGLGGMFSNMYLIAFVHEPMLQGNDGTMCYHTDYFDNNPYGPIYPVHVLVPKGQGSPDHHQVQTTSRIISKQSDVLGTVRDADFPTIFELCAGQPMYSQLDANSSWQWVSMILHGLAGHPQVSMNPNWQAGMSQPIATAMPNTYQFQAPGYWPVYGAIYHPHSDDGWSTRSPSDASMNP